MFDNFQPPPPPEDPGHIARLPDGWSEAVAKLESEGINGLRATFIRELITYGELTDQISYRRNEKVWEYLDQVEPNDAQSQVWDKLPLHQKEMILTQARSITWSIH